MIHEPLVFVGTCDLAGLVRGKGFPAEELTSGCAAASPDAQQHHDVAVRADLRPRPLAPSAI